MNNKKTQSKIAQVLPINPNSHPKSPNQIARSKKSSTTALTKAATTAPDVHKKPTMKKYSSNANFDISDVIVSSELSGRINTAKWINKANIVTPEYKKSSFFQNAGSASKMTECSPSSVKEEY